MPLSDVHPDRDPCLACGRQRWQHPVDPSPGEHQFEPAYIVEWLAA